LEKEGDQAWHRVLARAATDWDFRKRLLGNPRVALEREFALVLPALFRIRFVERDSDLDALVVLPTFRGLGGSAGEEKETSMSSLHDDDQLSDGDLEVVVGGLARAWPGTWDGAELPPPAPQPHGVPQDAAPPAVTAEP
jgi:hypothetical protein